MRGIKISLFCLSLLGGFTSAHAAESEVAKSNAATVVAFYNKALNDKNAEAAIAMMGPTYTQHDAHIADGKVGFRQFITGFAKKYPQSHSDIVRVVANDDYVVLHVHMIRTPGTAGDAVMDIFRLENGKLVEHWGVLQPVPATLPHKNTMF